MKVLHVPYTYYPDAVGGTEIFVKELARGLARLDVESVVCAPGPETYNYRCAATRVYRIRGEGGKLSVNYCYGDGDAMAAEAFNDVLLDELPDLVHVHAHSPMVSMKLALQVKAAGIPLVFSYHTAAATCQRGTMLRWGERPCSGELTTRVCASCIVHGRGMPKPLARVVGRIPPAMDGVLRALNLEGGPWTAMRMSGLVERKHAATRSFLALADAIVAPSPWVHGVLLANGIPASKVFVCGQGVDEPTCAPAAQISPALDKSLRIIALSRLEPTKGMDLLVDALAADPSLGVTLDIYGQADSGEGEPYVRELRLKIANDKRIRLMSPVEHEHVLATIRRYDLLAVPSQGFETGPLVVLEAFAARTPVLGSRLAGISDHVADGINGLLVRHDDPLAWATAMRRIALEPGLLAALQAGVALPASMSGIAERMKTLYSRLATASAAPTEFA